jgi:uncharacterized protein (DUF2132 family)
MSILVAIFAANSRIFYAHIINTYAIEILLNYESRKIPGTLSLKDPLEGKTLESILTSLVASHGWEFLSQKIAINCFANEPSINSSLKFLRRTPWARTKLEKLYLRVTPRTDS